MTDGNTDAQSARDIGEKSAELLAVEERITAARAELSKLQEIFADAKSDREKIVTMLTQVSELAASVKSQHDAVGAAALAVEKLSVDAKGKFDEVAAVATKALAASTQINDQQGVIAAKSAHIEDAKSHADKVRAELDRALTAATNKATEAEAITARTSATADGIAKLNDAAKSAKIEIDSNAAAIKKALETSTQDSQKTKSLADIALGTEERVNSYQTTLTDLHKKSQEKLAEIHSLLPGATSAGLAHAFDARGNKFTQPSKLWQVVFVVALVVLVIIAAIGLIEVYLAGNSLNYDGIIRLWLARLPIAGALVWLALYASREAALAKRLEEDYAYKAAISMSFQGFQQQMKAIQAEAKNDTPLGKLCSDTLATIASPPGRIYDKHKLTVSFSSELTEAIRAAVQAAMGGKGE
jgi:hypothetical protein